MDSTNLYYNYYESGSSTPSITKSLPWGKYPYHLIAFKENYVTGIFIYFAIFHEPDPGSEKILIYDFIVCNNLGPQNNWQYAVGFATPTSWINGTQVTIAYQYVSYNTQGFNNSTYLSDAVVIY